MLRGKRGIASTFFISVFILVAIILIKTGFFDQHLSLNARQFLWPLVIVLITLVVARITRQALERYFQRTGSQQHLLDKTRYRLFTRLVSIIIWAIGLGITISIVPQLRAASVSLFAGAGVAAIILGFALQKTFGNIASGVFIATFQPYRIGDRLKFLEEYGIVQDINLRHTVIATWDNRRIIVPNSKMDEEVIDNFTIDDPTILGTLDITISYDSDIDQAREIMREEAMMHPDFLDKHEYADMLGTNEPVRVRVINCGDYGVLLRLYYWAADEPTNRKMRYDLTERIKKRFGLEGVEIPYPYRTIVQKKVLRKQHAKLVSDRNRKARKLRSRTKAVLRKGKRS